MPDAPQVAGKPHARLSRKALAALRAEFPHRRIWQATNSEGEVGPLYAATSAKFTDSDLRMPGFAKTVVADTEADLRAALSIQPDTPRYGDA